MRLYKVVVSKNAQPPHWRRQAPRTVYHDLKHAQAKVEWFNVRGYTADIIQSTEFEWEDTPL